MAFRWLVGLFLLLLPLPALAVAVTGALRLLPTAEGLTVRLALSEPLAAPPRAFALADPMRWAVDLGEASSLRRDVAGAGPAKAARVSQFDPETVRLVLDLEKPMQLVSAYQDRNQVLELKFRPIDEAMFRRQVSRGRNPVAGFQQEAPRAVPPGPAPAPDLAADSAARLDAVEAALSAADQALEPPKPAPGPVPPKVATPVPPVDLRAQPTPPTKLAPPRQAPVVSARAPRSRRYVVVLDPGHGGTDPGAPSATGGNEKEVTLAVARLAKAAIERRARAKGVPVEVRLTRDGDYFVTLGGRVRLARQWGADLFISIHADSAPNIAARGASVYTLSETASDREAARVAAKENRADLISGVDLTGEDREVASILVDLGMRDSMNASSDFAEALQRGLEPEGVLFRSHFHRFANFQVLRNLGVPAVLLETGFLSNTQDAAYLFSKKGQAAIADGLGEAVVDYLARR
ncbi:N-acetylmuramoyl-L-alanine amidase [Sandaracinobacter sp. RS1-74]|uniref:N-acetylmuramoyl-L-alanine amidase n=1 Tax=Sandaracinobacteroides sayramensis TaxID=2913411 RepID=UPI001EDABD0C|nr:N-acetylmuramoyl-L-alanine amidase [Sandaracinobacteroides sayramensis]MCG2839655.1 N-acetylmuramoyl-L-alanine amidase [Sandaracinobacteroides sayramensis]